MFIGLFKKSDSTDGSNVLDYINALPSPLDPITEGAMLERSQNGDLDARNTLIEHNLRLVVYIAKRFDNTGTDIEELVSIGTLGLMKAVKSFSTDKNIKLATYASRCIENEILMFLRKTVRLKSEISFDEPINTDWEGNKLLLSDIVGTDPDKIFTDSEDKEEREILRELFSQFSERDKMIICMRYGLYGYEERTQKEIADLLSISQSYISRLEKKIIDKLKEELSARLGE
ncbi:MAG: sigma-70 family RNA polymerase sigma factor [Christensenellaceae bacterium]|nr:sigma-70 family RNA polymerase sigma factor [Christensenellaceae bacterium]